MTTEEMNAQIEALMKKYKLTMYGVIACIALYIVFLFFIKNTYGLIAVCVPMIVLAFVNNRYARQIKKLVAQRNEQMKKEKAATQALNPDEILMDDGAETPDASAIVANATSLNDLPKEYTVLDDVDVDGEKVDHIIASPYGVAIVNETDPTEKVRAIIQTLDLDPPIYYYVPDEDIALLAEKIQMPKEVVLTEPEVYSVLYRISGLK